MAGWKGLERILDENEPTIGDLVMLVGRLVQQVRRFDAQNDVAEDAMDYLRRKNLSASFLREFKARHGIEHDERRCP